MQPTQNILHNQNNFPSEMQNEQEPCLVNAKQGFTVFYKNKFLYSKYNPQASVEKIVEITQIPPSSLVIVVSPVLCYGFEKLLSKIDENSFVLAVEHDLNLYNFSIKKSPFDIQSHSSKNKYLFLENEKTIEDLFFSEQFSDFQKSIRNCRHVIKIELSAIDEKNKIFYDKLHEFSMRYIAQFWKNRITLTKLGKLYSKNILKNLSFLPVSEKLKFNSIEKDILVFGAGPSVDEFFEEVAAKIREAEIPKETTDKNASKNLSEFFIIAVDHALKPLLERNIVPDIVITVESQLANEKAFVGINSICKKMSKGFCLVSDLTARPNIIKTVLKNEKNSVSFFFTPFTQSNFLNRFYKNFSQIPYFQPMGSVGLYALEVAIRLRNTVSKNDCDLPKIFFTGLDFSFPVGKTHCKSSPSLLAQANCQNRLKSSINANASYSEGTKKTQLGWITNPALEGYALDAALRFSSIKNLYNLSKIRLGNIQNIQTKEIPKTHKNSECNYFEKADFSQAKINKFLQEEKCELEEIKNALMFGKMQSDELCSKIDEHDYLYLHFPDGNADCKNDISFLKRVRSEIDVFLKILKIAES